MVAKPLTYTVRLFVNRRDFRRKRFAAWAIQKLAKRAGIEVKLVADLKEAGGD